jgi:hypothetical protein
MVVGAIAALMVDVTTGHAQARSTRRIPISKEGGATPAPRVDTLTVYRTDTLRLYRTDTVTIRRIDTVRTEPAPPAAPIPDLVRQIGGFYFGADVGAALPTGAFDDAQTGGPHFGLQLGWDPIGMPVGVRFDGSYSHFDTRSQFEQFANDPQIVQFGGDLKLRLPVLSPWMRRFSVYGVGGVSYNIFKDIVEVSEGTISVGNAFNLTNATVATVDNDWHDEWGWNAGGGVQFGWGRTNLFVESRFMQFNHRVDINHVPIVVGLSWF